MSRVTEFFSNHSNISAIGVGSFGPIDLNPASQTYGHILHTPKQAWVNYDLLTPLKVISENLVLDTDVNCSAIGEHQYGAGKGLANFIYMTIGTGIGGSCVVGHSVVKGAAHSELGHMFVPYGANDEKFAGVCPYHGNCLEGLASGPAIEKRWGMKPELLPDDHQAWDLEARYIADGVANVIMVVMPQRIILGGGVMHNKGLLERIQKQVPALLGEYTAIDELTHSDYIVLPQLGGLSAARGALHMASQANTSK
jgi:fructokinase